MKLNLPLTVFVSLAALTGVSVHDTKLDKLASAVIGTPAIMSTTALGTRAIRGDDHTHVERVSLRDVRTGMPRIMPRNDHKKYLMQKNVPRGHFPFDMYCVPVA